MLSTATWKLSNLPHTKKKKEHQKKKKERLMVDSSSITLAYGANKSLIEARNVVIVN